MNDEMFRKSLIEVTNNDLLNSFVNNIFNYNLKNDQYIYIQYKIVNGNIVLNLYDNSDNNRFKAFIFSRDAFNNDENDIIYINIEECYKKYMNSNEKLILLGALLKTTNDNEKKEIIESLFDNGIRKIFMKNFI